MPKDSAKKGAGGELSWEMPGRVSIYDLQFGPAILKNNEWNFVDNIRTFNTGKFAERLTLMVRFSYKGSKSDIPLKFIIRLPGARRYQKKPCSSRSKRAIIHINSQFIILKTSWAAVPSMSTTGLVWWMCWILLLFLALKDQEISCTGGSRSKPTENFSLRSLRSQRWRSLAFQ